jgi:hypothetical protein
VKEIAKKRCSSFTLLDYLQKKHGMVSIKHGMVSIKHGMVSIKHGMISIYAIKCIMILK